MKKHRLTAAVLSMAAALVLTVICAGVTVSAANTDSTFTSGKFTYEVTSDKTVKTTKYNGTGKSAEIPSTVKNGGVTYYVKEVGDFTFENNANIASVKLPKGVESIGRNAFYSCTALRSVNIPKGVIMIDDGAFMFCEKLENVKLPSSLTTIGDGAFSDCKSFTEVTIPAKVAAISHSSFYGCENLKKLTISKGVKTIEPNAFCDCYSLETVTLPTGMKTVSSGAFCNCVSLKTVKIPSSVKSLAKDAFGGCTSLTNIKFPDGGVGGRFAVNFDTDGGTDVLSQTVKSGSKAKKPAKPEKYGFKFGGWYLDEDCTEAYDFKSPVKENLTLYAKWI